jgi:hypothetical protein
MDGLKVNKMEEKEPAHKKFVQKFLDWELVEKRLARYQHIGNLYDLDLLKQCSDKPPYYCHYLAWRLGTWHDENLFNFLDQLLANGFKLDGWNAKNKKSYFNTPDFGAFWDFYWELQVAKCFSSISSFNVSWLEQKQKCPDLKITTDSQSFFVECTVYHKSFTALLFMGELFDCINYKIKIQHRLFNKLSLPQKNSDINNLFDTIFTSFLNLDFLSSKLEQAENRYPVVLFSDPQIDNFIIYLEGDNSKNYDPSVLMVMDTTGCPEEYLNVAIPESMRNKPKQIQYCHPNLVAVNFLLSLDFQTASAIRKVNWGFPESQSSEFNKVDALLLAACGIDKELELSQCKFIFKPEVIHPLKRIVSNE